MNAQELKNQISMVVDKWVSEVLRTRFLQKPHNVEPRSLWDRFKQGFSNWWWGPRMEKKNKYRWLNRFGDELGVQESFDPSVFTLHDYMEIRSLVESVEIQLNESQVAGEGDGDNGFDKLRLMQIVRSAAERLKEMLFDTLSSRTDWLSSDIPINPGVGPEKKTRRTMPIDLPSAKATGSGGGEEEPPASDGVADPAPAADGAGDLAGRVVDPAPGRADASRSRKTDRQRIEEAAEEVSAMGDAEKHSLKPDKSWLKGGAIKKSRLPHVIAWMAMKSHLNPLSDDQIKDELKKALGVDVDLGVPGSRGGTLERYLRRVLDASFDSVMDKLGVKAEKPAVEPQRDTGGRRSDTAPEPPARSSRPKAEPPTTTTTLAGGAEVDSDDEDGEKDELHSYLYDGDKQRSGKSSLRMVDGFISEVAQNINSEKAARLKRWWDSEKDFLKDKNDSDIFDHLEGALLSGDKKYIAHISRAMGVDKETAKQKMIEFVRSKPNLTNQPNQEDRDQRVEDLLLQAFSSRERLTDSFRKLSRAVEELKESHAKADKDKSSSIDGWWAYVSNTIWNKSDPIQYARNGIKDGRWIEQISKILGISHKTVEDSISKHFKEGED